MLGQSFMTQKEVQTATHQSETRSGWDRTILTLTIFQRKAMPDGSVQNEGDTEVSVQPYQIPYGIVVPKKSAEVGQLAGSRLRFC